MMKIEVGKWYLTRDGRRAFIEAKAEEDYYCMLGWIESLLDEEYSWTINGDYIAYKAHPFDLVEELIYKAINPILSEEELKNFAEAAYNIMQLVPASHIYPNGRAMLVCPLCEERTSGSGLSILEIQHKEDCQIKEVMHYINLIKTKGELQ